MRSRHPDRLRIVCPRLPGCFDAPVRRPRREMRQQSLQGIRKQRINLVARRPKRHEGSNVLLNVSPSVAQMDDTKTNGKAERFMQSSIREWGLCHPIQHLSRTPAGHAPMAARLQHRTTTLSPPRKTSHLQAQQGQPPWQRQLERPGHAAADRLVLSREPQQVSHLQHPPPRRRQRRQRIGLRQGGRNRLLHQHMAARLQRRLASAWCRSAGAAQNLRSVSSVTSRAAIKP